MQLSDDIRRDRRERMRDIKYEREEVERRERAGRYDDRVVEREVIYESGRTGRHR